MLYSAILDQHKSLMRIICQYYNFRIELSRILEWNKNEHSDYHSVKEAIDNITFIKQFFNNERDFIIKSKQIRKAIIGKNCSIDGFNYFQGSTIEFDYYGEIIHDFSYDPGYIYHDHYNILNHHQTEEEAIIFEKSMNRSHYEDGGKYKGYHRRERGRLGSLPMYDNYDNEEPEWPFDIYAI